MGNPSHDRCYGIDKTTQKSGYGELTRKKPPLKKGDEGGFKISPNPSLRKRGMNTPTLSLPPLRGRMKVGGTDKTALAYGKRCKEECEVNKSFARHPISYVPDITTLCGLEGVIIWTIQKRFMNT